MLSQSDITAVLSFSLVARHSGLVVALPYASQRFQHIIRLNSTCAAKHPASLAPLHENQCFAADTVSTSQLEADRNAAQARVAELEGQIDAMIEQIGSPADEAVVRLESDAVRLREELRAAEQESEQAQAAAKKAAGDLESIYRERDSLRLQASQHPEAAASCLYKRHD